MKFGAFGSYRGGPISASTSASSVFISHTSSPSHCFEKPPLVLPPLLPRNFPPLRQNLPFLASTIKFSNCCARIRSFRWSTAPVRSALREAVSVGIDSSAPPTWLIMSTRAVGNHDHTGYQRPRPPATPLPGQPLTSFPSAASSFPFEATESSSRPPPPPIPFPRRVKDQSTPSLSSAGFPTNAEPHGAGLGLQ